MCGMEWKTRANDDDDNDDDNSLLLLRDAEPVDLESFYDTPNEAVAMRVRDHIKLELSFSQRSNRRFTAHFSLLMAALFIIDSPSSPSV